MPDDGEAPSPPKSSPAKDLPERVQRWVFIFLHVTLLVGAAAAVYERQWLTVLVTLGILAMTFLPTFFESRFKVDIPAEFETLAVLFVYAALFLGEVRGYYARYWWWDVALHTTSGFLLGILGFLLVYVLNETDRLEMHMRPFFVALFAFFFAVGIGALWEIFEFAMDQLAGTNMQKPMLGDPSGLTDTMWDLIVDTIGALIICSLGWWHMHYRTQSFVDSWIRKFIARNPRLFRKIE